MTVTPALTLDDLSAAVRELLDLAGVPYHHSDLHSYLVAVWGCVKLDPDPDHWARRYAAWVGLSLE
jgi:hypothetical protein